MGFTQGKITVSDGTRLNYLESGSGRPLVLIPGWSQTAEQFRHQLEGLADRYRVIAVDMRGHGDSDKPEFGYKIQRLAKDVRDVLSAMDLSDVAILGHSMGCSVLWCYWDLFGGERLSKFIFCDEPPFLTDDPGWTDEQRQNAGAIFTAESVLQTASALAGPDGEATTRGFIGGMVTSAMKPDVLDWMITCNLKLPRRHAAALLYNHCHQDWRDVIPRVGLPSLCIGGRVSLVPWKSVEWQAKVIPGARLEIFEESEGGQHFMFVENPDKFNRMLAEFAG